MVDLRIASRTKPWNHSLAFQSLDIHTLDIHTSRSSFHFGRDTFLLRKDFYSYSLNFAFRSLFDDTPLFTHQS